MRDGPAKILVSPFGRNHCDISFFSAGHPIFFNFCIALQNPCPGTVIKAEIKISGCIVNSSKMFKAQLPQIPPEIQQIILPNKELSVVDFLKFCLPAATQSFNGSFAPSQKLLSSLTPTITTIEEIQAIPTPPFAVLDELMKAPELSVSQSILSLHAPGFITERLPMWTLSYWVQVFHLHPLKKKWLDTEESLGEFVQSKRRTDDTRGLIKQVHSALACISWAGKLKGFSALITTDHLATYLTKNWFTDEHENQMLYLLQKEVSRTRRGDGIEVCDTFFTKRLLDIQKRAGKPDHYASSAHCAWL